MQIRMRAERTPSTVIAIADPGQEVRFISYGTLSPTDQTAVNPHTLYEIGSITKSFTSVVWHILMKQHGLSAETSFQELLDMAGITAKAPTYNGQHITLKHLLAHTSALPRLPGNMAPSDMNDPYREYTNEESYAFLESVTLEYAPGTRFAYSNYAYMLLGNLAERISGKPFESLLKEYITEPLNMAATSVQPADESNIAAPTNAGQVVLPWNMDHLRGLGELRSSASDLIRLVQAASKQLPFSHYEAFEFGRTPHATLRENYYMGPGWFIMTEHGDTLVYHGGGTGGFRTFAGYSLVSGRAIVVLANSNDDPVDIGRYLLNNAYGKAAYHDVSMMTEDDFRRLEGRYTSAMTPPFYITYEDHSLMGRMQGQPALPLTFVSPTEFRNRSVFATIKFKLDDNVATGFTLEQGSATIAFVRDADYVPAPDEPRSTYPPAEIDIPESVLHDYAGQFASTIGLQYTFTVQGGRLMATLTGQSPFQVFPSAQDEFFYRIVEAILRFERDDDGKVVAVTLHQGGQEIRFERQ